MMATMMMLIPSSQSVKVKSYAAGRSVFKRATNQIAAL
jgi:hypothetical protein